MSEKLFAKVKCECGTSYYTTVKRDKLGHVYFYLAQSCPKCGIYANYVDEKSNIILLDNQKTKPGK